MAEKKFEKKSFDKKDYKGVDDAAKNVKIGVKILAFGVAVGVGIKKYGPTVMKVAKNAIKKA